MDGMGLWWAFLYIGVLVVLVLALAVVVQTLRAHELMQALNSYSDAWERLGADLKSQTEANHKLQSGLRAERAHVAQLQRKVLLLQALLDEQIKAEALQAVSA
jgi:membrane protein required for beta-lactamase induction